MKATGIVRGMDELGRLTLPKELRTALCLESGTYAEIYLTKEQNRVIIEKTNSEKHVSKCARRKIDKLGRLVIPSSIRNILNIGLNEAIEIFTDGDKMVLRKYTPGCIFTGEIKDTVTYKGYNVSKEAIAELVKLANTI